MKIKKRNNSKKEDNLKAYAIGRITKSGVRLFEGNADDYFLKLPKNITIVSGKELGEMLFAYTQQKAYLRTLVSIAEVEVIQTASDYDEMYSRIYNECALTNVNDKKEYAKSNRLVRGYQKQLDKAEAVLKLASANLDSLDDVIFALSREITRRERQTDQENREHNIGKKKWGDKKRG